MSPRVLILLFALTTVGCGGSDTVDINDPKQTAVEPTGLSTDPAPAKPAN